MFKSTSSIYTTDFKSKKQKMEEAHQPSLKKHIEEVKQTGMKFMFFLNNPHDKMWKVKTEYFFFYSTCYSSCCSVHSQESDNWQHALAGAEIISVHQERVTCLSTR